MRIRTIFLKKKLKHNDEKTHINSTINNANLAVKTYLIIIHEVTGYDFD